MAAVAPPPARGPHPSQLQGRPTWGPAPGYRVQGARAEGTGHRLYLLISSLSTFVSYVSFEPRVCQRNCLRSLLLNMKMHISTYLQVLGYIFLLIISTKCFNLAPSS